MIHVVCLKWGTKYDAGYVNKLYSGINRNATIPFRFHCFTEDDKGIRPGITSHTLPFADKHEGWWNKLYLFSNHFPLRGKIVFFDLDTVITGNIDDVLNPPTSDFVVLRDFYAAKARGVDSMDMGSGLMSWDTTDGNKYSQIWEQFVKDPKKVMKELYPHGDQRWIQRFLPIRKYWQDILPDQVVSFKTHCHKGLPEGARVVCYHGKPSIPDSMEKTSKGWASKPIPPAKWIKAHWHE